MSWRGRRPRVSNVRVQGSTGPPRSTQGSALSRLTRRLPASPSSPPSPRARTTFESTVTAAATARRVFRDRCESHVHVAAVEACVGTACSLAGDPDTAVRFLARAVHFSPGSSAFRGELARVATYTSRGHAVTAAGCLVPAPSAQSVVTPTYTSPEACAIARYATVASTVHAAAACDCVEGWPVRDERRRDLARQGVPPVTVRDIGGGCVRAARPRRGPTRGGGRRWRWGPWSPRVGVEWGWESVIKLPTGRRGSSGGGGGDGGEQERAPRLRDVMRRVRVRDGGVHGYGAGVRETVRAGWSGERTCPSGGGVDADRSVPLGRRGRRGLCG